MKVYVVNWKETTIDSDNEMFVESGVCDYGYLDEKKAIKQIETLAEEKKAECIDEIGYPEKDVFIEGEEDFRSVIAGSNTYDYYVTIIEVEE